MWKKLGGAREQNAKGVADCCGSDRLVLVKLEEMQVTSA
jgi:hypothetical protein